MIVRPRPNVLKLFFIMQGSIVPRIALQLVAIAILSMILVIGHHFYPSLVPTYNNGTAFTMLGIALSIFLGFRNNACYDRWWEGRKIWGKVISSSRDVIRQVAVFDKDSRESQHLLALTSAFSQSLVVQLRKDKPLTYPQLLPEEYRTAFAKSHNPPSYILNEMALCLAHALKKGQISDIQFQMFDASLQRLNEAQAACERLKTTPVPFTYTLLLHRTAYIFCFLIPFGFTDILGWWTPVASLLVAYTLFGLDALSDELEQPFSDLNNALPISAMATTIERDVCAALSEPLPQPERPKNFILR